jgi:monoamine oxidase
VLPVVSCFAGSPAALERLEVAAGPGRWLESLAALRPELALDPDGAVLSTWGDDPWVGAAYSIFPLPELTAALAEPVGPLAFAGEHIGGAFNGLMEGAIRSGRAAAANLNGV